VRKQERKIDMNIPFRDKRTETRGRDWLKREQLQRLQQTVDLALRTPFYKKRLAKAGISSGMDIHNFDDIKRIPFTTKADLREAYPWGLLAVDPADVVRMHTSSGTTGTPTVIYHTREDLETWTDLMTRSITATGVTKNDVFQNMMTYGLFTGGLGLHYAAEKVGMMVIPAGSGNTKRQIKLMKDFGTTVVHATPSYMLHIEAVIKAEKIDRDELKLRKAFLGAEPYTENTRTKIESLLSIDAYNSYGLSEMNGPGVAFECVFKNGMHVWEDAYLVEVVDPDTLEPLGDNRDGELVFTTLKRQATPLLRYRTRDLSMLLNEPCACGRTHRRIARIKGRTDDMLIINGVNVFPSQIEEVLMKIPEVGSNYQIVVDKQGTLDRVFVKTEIYSKLFTGDVSALDRLKARLHDNIKSEILINTVIELHEPGGLPVYEGKAKRVLDERPEF
jgi:phenylacetate-CoA ligase